MELAYPSMDVRRTLKLFTAKEHINTLAAFDEGSLWVVLHNLGSVCFPIHLNLNPIHCFSCQRAPCHHIQATVVARLR